MEIEDEDEGYYNLPEPTINKLQKLSSPSQDEITRPTTLKQDLFENNNDTSLSQFEKHQLSLKSTISHLESESIAQKPWQLLGESSKNRPLNALLEEDLEIDYTAKPVPIITQETTKSLEDLIKDRISDAIFDSVERKIITTKTYNPNKRIEMDDEKSKLSLAQVYENEYKSLKNPILKTQKDLKIEKTHVEIQSMYDSLIDKLDSLTNSHYTPKSIKLDVAVTVDVDAITLEDIVPETLSNSKAITPNEIFSGEITKSRNEMTKTDSRKIRVDKKKRNKFEKQLKDKIKSAVELEKKEIGKITTSIKSSKESAVKELMKLDNVTILGGTDDKKTKKKNIVSTSSSKLML